MACVYLRIYDAISINAPHVYISALSWGAPKPVMRRMLVSENYWISVSPLEESKAANKVNDNFRELRDARCISFSPDGSKFASGHEDRILRIWDAVNSRLTRHVKAHDAIITDVKFSPDGRNIVLASYDKTIRILDARSASLVIGPLRGHENWVWTVGYSPDGTRIVSGSWDKTLRIWDAQIGETIGEPLKGHDDAVTAVSYSSDGGRIVSGSFYGTLRIWDARSGRQIGQPFRGHRHWVNSVAYSPDEGRIVSGSDDGTVRIWDAHTGGPIGKPLEGHRGYSSYVWSVAYTPDGSRIVSGTAYNTVWIWDASSRNVIGVIARGESRWDSGGASFLSVPSWWPVSELLGPRAPLIRESLIHSDAPIQISDDGWLRTLDGNLLLWVPAKYREDICCRGPMGDVPPRLKFDWKGVPHGKDWRKIKEFLKEPIDQ